MNDAPQIRTSLNRIGEGVRNELGKGGVDSQVGPHDDEEVSPFGYLGLKELSVVDGLLRRVDRAGTNDDKNPIIVPGQNPSGVVASRGNRLLGGRGRNDLMAKEGGLDEGVVLKLNRVRNGKWEEMAAVDVHQRRGDPECSLEAFPRYQGRERHHRKCERKTCFWRWLKVEEGRRKGKRDGREEERTMLTKPPSMALI